MWGRGAETETRGWLEPVGVGSGWTRPLHGPSRVCGLECPWVPAGTSVPSGTQYRGWADSRDHGRAVSSLRAATWAPHPLGGSAPAALRLPRWCGDHREGWVIREKIVTPSQGFVRGRSCGLWGPQPLLFPQGDCFLLSFPSVWEAGSQIHHSLLLACLFLGLTGSKSLHFQIPPRILKPTSLSTVYPPWFISNRPNILIVYPFSHIYGWHFFRVLYFCVDILHERKGKNNHWNSVV